MWLNFFNGKRNNESLLYLVILYLFKLEYLLVNNYWNFRFWLIICF